MPPQTRLWTVEQFHYIGDHGVFRGNRVLLIEGVVLEEGQMNPLHAIALELTTEVIHSAFGSGWRIRGQMPLVLGQNTDPKPDVAVIAGSVRGTSGHPTTANLVIEIADISLSYDTTIKAELYATAGIEDYWVLDVDSRQLLVFRDPTPIAAGGTAYRTQLTLGPIDSIAPLAVLTSSIRVADLLP